MRDRAGAIASVLMVVCMFAVIALDLLFVPRCLYRRERAAGPVAGLPLAAAEATSLTASTRTTATRLDERRLALRVTAAPSGPAAKLSLTLRIPGVPRFLYLHSTSMVRLVVSTRGQDGSSSPEREVLVGGPSGDATERWAVDIGLDRPAGAVDVVVAPLRDTVTTGPELLIDEIGVAERLEDALVGPEPWTTRFARVLPFDDRCTGLLLTLTLAPIGLVLLAGRRATPLRLGLFASAGSLLVIAVTLRQIYSHEIDWLKWAWEAVTVGGNLGESIQYTSLLRQGQGVTPLHRMPGYTLLTLLVNIGTPVTPCPLHAARMVLFQMSLHAAAIGAFVATVAATVSPLASLAIAGAFVWMPTQIEYTQVDSVVPAVGLLILAALLRVEHRGRDGQPVPVRYHGAVHAGFALYFALRTDVVPAWAAMSLLLHRRQWRRLILPAAFFLSIGGAWGTYKTRYGQPFVMTTSTAAIGMWAGLWQVPDSRFKWICDDGSGNQWTVENGWKNSFDPDAQGWIRRETMRFMVTYPVYTLSVMLHKAIQFYRDQNGGTTSYRYASATFTGWLSCGKWVLAVLILVAMATGYERWRTFALAWPAFFIQPIFWVFYDSLGRFIYFVNLAILAAGLILVLDPRYWLHACRRWQAACPVVLAGGLAMRYAEAIDGWLLANTQLRYWTPLLDPSPFTHWLK
jgi:hypothetical protein